MTYNVSSGTISLYVHYYYYIGDIFKAVMTEVKFAKSECYKINRKYFLPKN